MSPTCSGLVPLVVWGMSRWKQYAPRTTSKNSTRPDPNRQDGGIVASSPSLMTLATNGLAQLRHRHRLRKMIYIRCPGQPVQWPQITRCGLERLIELDTRKYIKLHRQYSQSIYSQQLDTQAGVSAITFGLSEINTNCITQRDSQFAMFPQFALQTAAIRWDRSLC